MPFLKSFSTYEIRHKYVKKQQKKTETKPQISKNAYISQTNGMDQKWRVCTSTSTWVYLSSREQMFVWKNGFLTTEKKSESSKVKGITTKNYVANRFNNAMFFLELNNLEMDCLFSANEFSHFNNQLSRYEKKTNTQQSGSMQLPAALFMYKAIQQSIEEHSPTREPMFHGCTLICVNQWLCFIRTNHPD